MDFASVYTHLVGDGPDSRVTSWPLLDGWEVPTAISAVYILGIPIGMSIMKDREPFKLKAFSLFHNFFLFTLSMYMTVETLRQAYLNFGWSTNFTIFCNSVEQPQQTPTGFSESGEALATILWIHYISKAYEFFDTVIMIMKKNNRQVSFLHVYHHATTFFPVWYGNVRYGPGGEAYYCCALNSFVHVFMYGYYFFASVGLPLPFIKRSITMFQMVQFVTYIVQSVYILFITDCQRPRLSGYFLLVQAIIFLVLFAMFFVQSYLKPKKQGDKKKQ
ncbi:hypothetical protein CYMTET_45078 [Cymbomonas tetramitiformis]|uniref:Very-long-chain 3-oxoacyl-CoA synthase n=1 Tax=Cymbomonas tetramitiformis TaxID=36881 RepID=A0AAE0EYP0_9CHLO|nr:hypothetical protein CYMTET_45078 [Cymbomonas tetramitiformis]